jgi:flagellin
MTFQADSNGTLQKLDITLPSLETMAGALTAINSQLQASNQSALQSIVAVADGAGSIGFTSTKAFNVTINAATTAAKGFTAPGSTLSASVPVADTLANASVATASSAQAAVTALSAAVAALGKAQAVVGKGENQFNYAINLAQSQNTNLAAAESRIRDADLAAEAANLTKAQILLQAGTAAVAQANTSAQAVLALLK